MHRRFYIAFLIFSLICLSVRAQDKVTINGFVREENSRELLPGVTVYMEDSPYGTTTNNYGFYSLTVPRSDTAILFHFSFVGYQRKTVRLSLRSDTKADIILSPQDALEEVVISEKRQREKISESVQMSRIEIPIAQVKKIPAFLGEKDVLKVLQLMPGVQKGTEGQTGLYVRGGGPDQNLIILDDANVYNASHLFGFFSVFNSDALKSVELIKGGFPARYGGRLSSVVEMNMKEGSKEKLHGEGGIGLISSRLTLEGPWGKKKGSFLVSGRRTYIDVLAAPLIAQQQSGMDSQVKPGYYFYDLNAKMNYDFDDRNKLYVSGYFGQDRFRVREKSTYDQNTSGLWWGNATATLRWNRLINQKLFANTSLIYSYFNFSVFSNQQEIRNQEITDEFSLDYSSRIRDFSLKVDFDYYPDSRHAVKFGVQAIAHRFAPSALVISGNFTDDRFNFRAKPIHSLETGIYVEDTWQAADALKANIGFRLSSFQTVSKTYLKPEPRISLALKLDRDMSAKASYAQMNQYVHLLSNTGLGLPTDLWVPTTGKVAPQQSSQVALGLARDLNRPDISVSVEGYYKHMRQIISYKEGSSFLSVEGENANEINWEDNITSGNGWSYGAEFLVQKKTGRWSGWIGYTLSWTQWKFPELNFGKTFYPRYDRRHDISVVGIYELSKRTTLSATWVYGTGNALTMPIGRYTVYRNRYDPSGGNMYDYLSGRMVSEYDQKNTFRAEAYHRLDIAVQFHKKKKRHERTWEIGLYNAYNRRNPFFYNINEKEVPEGSGQRINVLTRYSLFPVIPSVSYNFKF